MILKDENYTYLRLHNGYIGGLHGAIIEALFTLNRDKERDSLAIDRRLKAAEYFLLSFVNELNHAELLNANEGTKLREFMANIQNLQEPEVKEEHGNSGNTS